MSSTKGKRGRYRIGSTCGNSENGDNSGEYDDNSDDRGDSSDDHDDNSDDRGDNSDGHDDSC
ncbi:hypothetical protein ZOD2009_00880 [Haladaptatus paucihalophilus DX253]|uniref:Uncharacterized protein n=1 Tax=Haladaptatus paucihalophilus DX253 TaxID=797209 RepID=E7QP00_HALPU|nr:hypothetical protein [Haladaptatus paucihalophilus]EFW93653.1 hypothetical protein ZOD2009_00880 [Haladaptatus paucihalophilus DX253]